MLGGFVFIRKKAPDPPTHSPRERGFEKMLLMGGSTSYLEITTFGFFAPSGDIHMTGKKNQGKPIFFKMMRAEKSFNTWFLPPPVAVNKTLHAKAVPWYIRLHRLDSLCNYFIP